MRIINSAHQRFYIELVPNGEPGTYLFWNVDAEKMFTLQEIDQIISILKISADNMNKDEVLEINQAIHQQEVEDYYEWLFECHARYTNHVLSKDYQGDVHGHVVCYEDPKSYLHFDCTKKTKHTTVVELLKHIGRDNNVIIHHVFETIESKKLCYWLGRLFSPGIRRNIIRAGSGAKLLEPYSNNLKNYIIESLKTQRQFPKGINDLIVNN